MLSEWLAGLDSECRSIVGEIGPETPPELAEAIQISVQSVRHPQLHLLACAAAEWCGGEPEDGLTVAVASRFMSAALEVHCGIEAMQLSRSGNFSENQVGEVQAILAGDSLIPMALDLLARRGGRHALLLLEMATEALGSEGALAGLSINLDLDSGNLDSVPDGRDLSELRGGRIAQFCAAGGALLANASEQRLDDCSLLGMKTGIALDVLVHIGAEEPDPSRRKDLLTEVSTLLGEVKSIAGRAESAELFRQIAEYVASVFPSGPDELF